jgi:hypothetical protein
MPHILVQNLLEKGKIKIGELKCIPKTLAMERNK